MAEDEITLYVSKHKSELKEKIMSYIREKAKKDETVEKRYILKYYSEREYEGPDLETIYIGKNKFQVWLAVRYNFIKYEGKETHPFIDDIYHDYYLTCKMSGEQEGEVFIEDHIMFLFSTDNGIMWLEEFNDKNIVKYTDEMLATNF